MMVPTIVVMGTTDKQTDSYRTLAASPELGWRQQWWLSSFGGASASWSLMARPPMMVPRWWVLSVIVWLRCGGGIRTCLLSIREESFGEEKPFLDTGYVQDISFL